MQIKIDTNMRLLALIVFGALMTMMSACDIGKSNGSTNAEKAKFGRGTKDPSMVSFPTAVNLDGDYKSVEDIRLQALSIINHRIKQAPNAYAIITAEVWLPEFVNDTKHFSDEFAYQGQWIDFNDDFTYEYGYYDDVWGKGKYHYTITDDELIMLDNDSTQEPKAWVARNNGDMMVFIGKHNFGVNNGWQMRLLPAQTRPTKKK